MKRLDHIDGVETPEGCVVGADAPPVVDGRRHLWRLDAVDAEGGRAGVLDAPPEVAPGLGRQLRRSLLPGAVGQQTPYGERASRHLFVALGIVEPGVAELGGQPGPLLLG